MDPKTFAICSSVIIMLFVVELIRRQKMSFKYSAIWLLTSLATLFLSIFDSLLKKMSEMLGFALLSNFIFFLLLIFFILFSLLLTLYINEQNSRNELLAQSIAALEYKIKQLQGPSPNQKDPAA